MCGICGIISQRPVSERLHQSLRNLDYRGYDSCGIAVYDQGTLIIRKDVGRVEDVAAKHGFSAVPGQLGIAHTRWATHGGVTTENSHPHLSCDGKIAVIHNGIISNYRELRGWLQQKGHAFKSETDTEVLAHLLEHFFAQSKDLEQALIETARNLDGTYAFAAISAHQPDRIFCARHVSPLIIGVGSGEMYLASDINAFISYTRDVIELQDGEYAVLTRQGARVRNMMTGEEIHRQLYTVPWSPAAAQKGGFPHYMTKEIHEQPDTIRTALKIPSEQIDAAANLLAGASSRYIIGVGTTYYVALISSYYASRIAGIHIPAISSDEFEYLARSGPGVAVLAFSQSGETFDTLNALRFARARGAKLAAVINALGSTMAREVDVNVMQCGGPEISVLSTKAAVSQIVIFLRILLRLAQKEGALTAEAASAIERELHTLPDVLQRILDESKGFIRNVARKYLKKKNWLFVGRGIYYAIALEAALKMKEAAYQHAEGIQGGFMKHGTIALIDDDMLSAFFVPPCEDKALFGTTINNAEEIKARRGIIVGFHFGDEDHPVFDDQVRLPKCPPLLAPIALLVVGQLFAYFTAVDLKRDVDRPRSLAKSVTVA